MGHILEDCNTVYHSIVLGCLKLWEKFFDLPRAYSQGTTLSLQGPTSIER